MSRVQLDPIAVKELFTKHAHQYDVVIELYRMVFPHWDSIQRIHGWPTINQKTNAMLSTMFQDFDYAHHPRVMPGGLWMNNGFSTSRSEEFDLKNWEVELDTCKVEMWEQRLEVI